MTLYNIFENFDLDKNGYLAVEELEGILHKLDKSFEKD
jgi:Ca2+-binding EF-hand superfamily protein